MAPAERHERTNLRERMENQRNTSRDRPVKISRSLQRLHADASQPIFHLDISKQNDPTDHSGSPLRVPPSRSFVINNNSSLHLSIRFNNE